MKEYSVVLCSYGASHHAMSTGFVADTSQLNLFLSWNNKESEESFSYAQLLPRILRQNCPYSGCLSWGAGRWYDGDSRTKTRGRKQRIALLDDSWVFQ